MRRALFATVLFPVVLFGILSACSHLLGELQEPVVFNQYAGIGPIGVLTVFVLMCAICLPALALAIWRRRLNLAEAAIFGLVAGFLAFNTPNAAHLLDDKLRLQFRLQEALTAYPFAVAGALAAAIVWLVAAWRNPRFANQLPNA